MSKFQRRAYLSLLSKKGSWADPKNYRPLALLNKTPSLDPRLWLIALIMLYVPYSDICKRTPSRDPAGAICLDFAKAFDSVNWQALDQVEIH
ncbi:unnamed protein product [Peronospora farinosa]|uniref:Reverse transcriptase domain-containing protein n=1 Tax=Peronospora farinosa TaxID=134698 RepID=A0ABN8BX20_9STRA|nr:unnamed protein product [Peronospora farinosa]